jgi:diguanylate cyclase (GGDEF)-like protein
MMRQKFVLLYVLLVTGICGEAASETLRISVATTANEQGLITALAERFHARYPQHNVEISEVGALATLEHARDGKADAVITHHPASEKVFMNDGLGLSRTLIMYNQFALIGPKDDPLEIAGETELPKVLRRLADNEVDFFVQGQKSGTYQRFAELLELARVEPDWLGLQSMESSSRTTVLAASQFDAYSFADLGTYFSLRDQVSESIVPLYRDHKSLQNYYTYLIVNPQSLVNANAELATLFLNFLISTETQNFIDRFGRDQFHTNVFTASAHMDTGLQIKEANNKIKRQQQKLFYTMLFAAVVLLMFILLGVLHIKARRLEKERQIEQARFMLAVSGTNDGIWDWDMNNKELFIATRTRKLLGTSNEADSLVELLESVIEPVDFIAFQNAFISFLDDVSARYFDSEFRIRNRQQTCWIRLRGKVQRDTNGNAQRMAGSITDTTDIHKKQEEIRHQALHDPLTDLPNRNLILDRLDQTIIHSSRQSSCFSLLMIDLDRFKQINDTLGHSTGDELIKNVARRLQAVLRESDTVSRLGGDEFAILLPDIDAAQATHVAKKIAIAMKRDFTVNGNQLNVSGSIGMALFPQHGSNSEILLQRADVAMYHAKREGSSIAVYAAEQDRNSARALALESKLRLAIDRDELDLYYQPKIDLMQNRIVGVEALLRWHEPGLGNINIEEIITLAENTGLIKPLTRWVIRHAMRTSHYWSTQLHIELPISVNLSIWDLQDPGIAAYIRKQTERWYRTPHHIEFEITESAMMSNPERTLNTLGLLADMGYQMSVDDFGTGFSSLVYLKKFPVRSLKIDKSFVMDMLNDANDHTIVRSTLELAHGMGLTAIAEGVESEAILNKLSMMGCDIAQGYYISRPMSSDDFIQWFHQSKWKPVDTRQPSGSARKHSRLVH